MARFGVLALQGDFHAHAAALRALGEEAVEVRRSHQLDGLAGVVIPGGESTTLLNLMRDEPWFERLTTFHESGGALLGTCAGAILLAREVRGPAQLSLGLLDAVVERNAYGRQVDSFEAEIAVRELEAPLHAVFIRAPRFRELGSAVEILAAIDDEPVLVRQGRILAGAFHPELTSDRRLHRLFVKLAGNETIPDIQARASTAAGPTAPAVERRVPC
jgi:5'-phosphate synthase pdxT subunit